jgi:hypothetical protein
MGTPDIEVTVTGTVTELPLTTATVSKGSFLVTVSGVDGISILYAGDNSMGIVGTVELQETASIDPLTQNKRMLTITARVMYRFVFLTFALIMIEKTSGLQLNLWPSPRRL